MQSTLIDDINYDEYKNNYNDNDYESNIENILDLSLDEKIRLNLFVKYYDEYKDSSIEIVSQISTMYQFSGTKILESFLYEIAVSTNVSSFLKIECVKSLLSFYEALEIINEKEDSEQLKLSKIDSNNKISLKNKVRQYKAYYALFFICDNLDNSLTTPYKIETIFLLMKNKDYFNNATNYFNNIINDTNISCEYRYKTILSLEKKKDDIYEYKLFMKNACISFINYRDNLILYRILASQNLLQNLKHLLNDTELNDIEQILLTFATDKDLEYNLRADSSDTLINLGSENMKNIGRKLIEELGSINGRPVTVFHNMQNVHVKSIESSVFQIIDILSTYPSLKIDDNIITIDDIFTEINKIIVVIYDCNDKIKTCFNYSDNISRDEIFCCKNCNDSFQTKRKIIISLNRIKMDRTLYKNFSLSNILVKIWSYIKNSEFKSEMNKRLFEELEDMSGTCSTGFLSRLINVLSGFGEINISISFDEQIVSNFSGRLNYFARKITDRDSPFYTNKLKDVISLYLRSNTDSNEIDINDDKEINRIIEIFSENVINEMMVKSSNFSERINFLLFFRTYMPKIRYVMFNEFKYFVTDSEFDLAFRKAISFYEEGSFV